MTFESQNFGDRGTPDVPNLDAEDAERITSPELRNGPAGSDMRHDRLRAAARDATTIDLNRYATDDDYRFVIFEENTLMQRVEDDVESLFLIQALEHASELGLAPKQIEGLLSLCRPSVREKVQKYVEMQQFLRRSADQST